jgi:hypothetical protein
MRSLLFFLLAFRALTVTAAEPGSGGETGSGPFVFAYFNTGGQGRSQGLQFAYSRDGYTWTEIPPPAGDSFLKPAVGGGLMRDPSIVHGPDGEFHLVWTTSWRNPGFGYARSKDLENWTHITAEVNYPDGWRHGTAIKISKKRIEEALNEF